MYTQQFSTIIVQYDIFKLQKCIYYWPLNNFQIYSTTLKYTLYIIFTPVICILIKIGWFSVVSRLSVRPFVREPNVLPAVLTPFYTHHARCEPDVICETSGASGPSSPDVLWQCQSSCMC